MGRKLKDEEVIGPKGLEYIADLIAAMVPFVSPLRFSIPPFFDFDRGIESRRAVSKLPVMRVGYSMIYRLAHVRIPLK